MSLTDEKTEARRAAFARRSAAHKMNRGGASGMLSEVLAGHRGVPVAGYLPIKTEIDPRGAMAEASAYGEVGVPVIQGAGQPLIFAQWVPEIPLVDGPFGAQVPAELLPIIPQIVIVPLVAFDRRGGRLGYGGGFYDRTLEWLREKGPVMAIGFAYGAQEADHLPLEPTDQPLDLIVTERRVIEPIPA